MFKQEGFAHRTKNRLLDLCSTRCTKVKVCSTSPVRCPDVLSMRQCKIWCCLWHTVSTWGASLLWIAGFMAGYPTWTRCPLPDSMVRWVQACGPSLQAPWTFWTYQATTSAIWTQSLLPHGSWSYRPTSSPCDWRMEHWLQHCGIKLPSIWGVPPCTRTHTRKHKSCWEMVPWAGQLWTTHALNA